MTIRHRSRGLLILAGLAAPISLILAVGAGAPRAAAEENGEIRISEGILEEIVIKSLSPPHEVD